MEHTEGVWRNGGIEEGAGGAWYSCAQFLRGDPDLVSLDGGRRAKAYEAFADGGAGGVFRGGDAAPGELCAAGGVCGERPYGLGQAYKFGDVFRTRIPEGFSWAKLWDVLVESCRATATIAASHGRTIIMEPRVGEVICSVDSMIRLINDVGMKNFKANFDTGHFSAQRENVVLALMKLEGMFANIHVSDNNPATTDHLPVGEGMGDGGLGEFFRVLKRQNYTGYLGLDLGNRPTLVADLQSSAAYLQKVAGAQGVTVEK